MRLDRAVLVAAVCTLSSNAFAQDGPVQRGILIGGGAPFALLKPVGNDKLRRLELRLSVNKGKQTGANAGPDDYSIAVGLGYGRLRFRDAVDGALRPYGSWTVSYALSHAAPAYVNSHLTDLRVGRGVVASVTPRFFVLAEVGLAGFVTYQRLTYTLSFDPETEFARSSTRAGLGVYGTLGVVIPGGLRRR